MHLKKKFFFIGKTKHFSCTNLNNRTTRKRIKQILKEKFMYLKTGLVLFYIQQKWAYSLMVEHFAHKCGLSVIKIVAGENPIAFVLFYA